MRFKWFFTLFLVVLLTMSTGVNVYAQDDVPPPTVAPRLAISTDYPVRRVVAGESVTFDLTLAGGATAETVYLDVEDLPEGWTATFRGGGDIVEAVYVEPENSQSVDLKVTLPKEAAIETYDFSVVAEGETQTVRMPLGLTVEEKLPPSLTWETELPTLKGKASTSFNYDATLKNESDEELSINLIAEAPPDLEVTFKLTGKEVTSFPIAPGETKRLDVEVDPDEEIAGGTYQIEVLAQGGKAQARTTLVAEVSEVPGKPSLNLMGPGGRLSGEAYVGKETSIDLIVENTGNAPASNVKLSASEPSGWTVNFEPEEIAELAADSRVEVTAKIEPAEKAVAGDYEVTFRARPDNGTSDSADFRITVRTSTLWGVVGIGIIAVAVVIVGLAVMRFGRR
jgi:uncharacterized membrane protein